MRLLFVRVTHFALNVSDLDDFKYETTTSNSLYSVTKSHNHLWCSVKLFSTSIIKYSFAVFEYCNKIKTTNRRFRFSEYAHANKALC